MLLPLIDEFGLVAHLVLTPGGFHLTYFRKCAPGESLQESLHHAAYIGAKLRADGRAHHIPVYSLDKVSANISSVLVFAREPGSVSSGEVLAHARAIDAAYSLGLTALVGGMLCTLSLTGSRMNTTEAGFSSAESSLSA